MGIRVDFPIPFAGESGYTDFYVSANGTISFSNQTIGWKNTALPSATYQTLIAPYWDDLNPGQGGGVYGEVVGQAPNREVVIEWRDIPHYKSDSVPGTITFQVVLFEDRADILFNYKDVSFGSIAYDGGSSATIGIQIDTGTQAGYNIPLLVDQSAFLWKTHQNQAPVAEIQVTGDQKIGQPIQLDGGASQDPDGQLVSYSWRIVEGNPEAQISAPSVVYWFPATKTTCG